jgi:hypothetical protein
MQCIKKCQQKKALSHSEASIPGIVSLATKNQPESSMANAERMLAAFRALSEPLTGVAPSKAPCARPGVARSLSAIRWHTQSKLKKFLGWDWRLLQIKSLAYLLSLATATQRSER